MNTHALHAQTYIWIGKVARFFGLRRMALVAAHVAVEIARPDYDPEHSLMFCGSYSTGSRPNPSPAPQHAHVQIGIGEPCTEDCPACNSEKLHQRPGLNMVP